MKTRRPAHRPGGHEQRTPPRHEDAYRADAKPPNATCPRCGASCIAGRWSWRHAQEGAASETCPACRRIEANDPAGRVMLAGPFFAAHREEILARVQALAMRARGEHPMQRLIGAQQLAQGVLLTTTDAHLARAIGVALVDSFKGDLDLRFGPDENLVRVAWTR